jgi:hypothetical protein
MLIGNLKETFLSLQFHRKTRRKKNPLGAHGKNLVHEEAHNGLMVAVGT